MKRINQVYTFMVVNAAGNESVPGYIDPRDGVAKAMMGADLGRVAELRAIVEDHPAFRGLKVTILRFGHREDIGVIDRTKDTI